jgi:hypothetical protein
VGRGGAVTQDRPRPAGENGGDQDPLAAQPLVTPGVHAPVQQPQPAGRQPPRDHVASHAAIEQLPRRDHPPLPPRHRRRQPIGATPRPRCLGFVLTIGTNPRHPAIVPGDV